MPDEKTESGTAVLDQAETTTETKTEQVKEETKAPTFRELEEQWQKDQLAKTGKVPKKEEAKPEVKTEAKVEEKKVETPPVEPKKKGGFTRTISRLQRELGAKDEHIRQMDERLKALESGRRTTTTEKVVEDTPKEPTLEDFGGDVPKYIAAIRVYDKEMAARERQKAQEEQGKSAQDEESRQSFNKFVDNQEKFKKTVTDWDDVVGKSKVELTPLVTPLIITAIGAEGGGGLGYELAKNPKWSSAINELSKRAVHSLARASDDLPGIIRYLGAHPEDVDKLNALDGSKADKFVGILEVKMAPSTEKKEETKPAPSGSTAGPKAESKPEEPVVEARKQRPEPPPKVTGSAPSSVDYHDTQDMSLQERERLFLSDPRNKRR